MIGLDEILMTWENVRRSFPVINHHEMKVPVRSPLQKLDVGELDISTIEVITFTCKFVIYNGSNVIRIFATSNKAPDRKPIPVAIYVIPKIR